MASSRQAEKEYLRRSGAAPWERVKPFAPTSETTVVEGLRLIQDFGACVALLDPMPHHKILDLAAGGGWAAEWLQRLGLSVVAADLSSDLLAIARERLARTGRGHVVCGDAEALPFRAGTFDRVLCLNAMHHFPDLPSALREIARVLRRDGRAVFSEPGAGHAGQPHSVRAVQDFGVREADIDAAEFLDQCRAAGFPFVVIEPFTHVVTGHGLTAEHWHTWRKLARASRVRRAARTLRRGLLELVGTRKETELFTEAFGSEVLRVLGAAMQDHPIVVASKQPLDRFLCRSDGGKPAMAACIRLVDAVPVAFAAGTIVLKLEIQNSGTLTWFAGENTRGHVRIGAQLLDAERRLLNRDHARESLPHDVPAGGTIHVEMSFVAPATPGAYVGKIDLVSEGVSWFEPHGSEPAVHGFQVTAT
jgi:SAM-dependent methyltransferase